MILLMSNATYLQPAAYLHQANQLQACKYLLAALQILERLP